ncbi:MAG: excinuclease ABC subunit UvrA [Myxococcales bacterium]|nr:excinuclease ABC subunit UvrA [Myxococcales bacterium]
MARSGGSEEGSGKGGRSGGKGERPARARELGQLEIRGARTHNLQVDSLSIPKRSYVVFTGVSGSGKSSMAFDTLYAEGQRRYIESLSSYARQFLGQLDRPPVEHLRGLSPTIAIEQKSASSNPRSTVGTITEIHDYLRVLYARVGEQHCHACGKRVRSQSPQEVVQELLAELSGAKLTLLAPIVSHRKGEYRQLLTDLRGRGYVRVRVDGEIHRLEDVPALDKQRKHSIELVIDRVTVADDDRQRLTESVELALTEGKGELLVDVGTGAEPLCFSESRSCCGHAFPELSPQSFSFNSPLGMCQQCNGLGRQNQVDPALVIPEPQLSIREGAIAPWRAAMERGEGWTFRIIDAISKACKVDLDKPWKRLGKRKQEQVLYGLGERRIRVEWGQEGTESHGSWGLRFEGVIPQLVRRYKQTNSQSMRDHYARFMTERACEACGGHRLRPESLAVRLGELGIAELSASTVREASDFVSGLALGGNRAAIAESALAEVQNRLGFLLNVGLNYLTLDRAGPSLSGGEAQRIRLASQLGSELSGVMYVLDEPSIGLHQRDNARLISTLEHLRDLGNTVIVVEHDEATIRAADHVVDFGPGAGHHGGHVVFSGTPKALLRCKQSLTAQYLSGRRSIEVPKSRRQPGDWLRIVGARENNLKSVDVKLPLGALVAVTGVSGAGKSSLINTILLPALSRELSGGRAPVGAHDRIEGIEAIERVISIDQKPIGRTPRSNPATYTKAFDEVRAIFAELPEARARGYKGGRFSFNVKGGRCEACEGDGVVRVEMHFLSDVYVPCELCGGKRYNAQTLEVRYRDHSIADVLEASVDDCRGLFAAHTQLLRILETLSEVGLGYVKLGQPAPTLSGGEAQRVKLSRELGKKQRRRTLYVLDEPTTGLHFDDIHKLLGVLQQLVDAGHTVVVIEHNLDVIKCADWVVDLGPEGGEGGGRVVAEGTPEQIARVRQSHTGQFLKEVLGGASSRPVSN